MGGRGAVRVAVAVWAGMLAARAPIPVVLLLGVGGLAAAVAWRATGARGDRALILAVAVAAAARATAEHAVVVRARGAIREEHPVRLEGRVIEPPLLESGAALAMIEAQRGEPRLPPGTRVRVRLPEGASVEWGDRVACVARLAPPGPARNPGGIDGRAAADAEALAASGVAFTLTPLTRAATWQHATAMRWRRALERSFADGLEPQARELVTPLVTGDRSALPSDLNAAFKAAGLVHLLALSGLHVTWMAGIARLLVAACGGGLAARALAGAGCALAYAGIAGPLPSLMRAVGTECFTALARLLGRPLDPIQALALSALACLLLAPGWALDLGFQLSCAATAGLLTLGTVDRPLPRAARRVLAPLIPTVSAQVTAMPLLLLRMHALSWVAPVANLAAVPVSGLLLAGAWLAALWDLALPGTARVGFAACDALAALLRAITETSARLPHATFATGGGATLPVAAALGAVLLAIGLAPRRALARGQSAAPRTGLVVPGVAIVAGTLVAAAAVRPLHPPAGSAWVIVLDVDQGDAITVGLSDGWWLVDAGPRTPARDAGEQRVVPFLRWAAVRTLEGLVLTHDDSDHTGGARAVERSVRVRRLLATPPRPGCPGPGGRFGAAAIARGDTLHRDPSFTVLWPPRPDSARADPIAWTDNHGAVVLDLACDSTHALLLADLDAAGEDSLAVARAALLKVGHHGSRTSSSPAFLARARPRFAAISVGRWNRFGHPHPEIVARLVSAGAEVHRTDREGALWFELDDRGIRLVDSRGESVPGSHRYVVPGPPPGPRP